ncbi:MAG TPA: YdcF family protein [Dongiaceae bacterium]|nr:YdcF family protein [Dongiaceae bacterium]
MRWLFIIPVFVAALIVGITIYLQPNSFVGCKQQPVEGTSCNKADAIVVVSGGDTEARTNAGINLYENGWADTVIFSGAAQDKSGPSNAEAMKKQALAAGVPESAILVDSYSANTQQNAENAQSIFKQHDFHNVILVTSGYHQRRANLEFTKRGDGITIRNYPVTNDKDWSWFWWLTPKGWWLAGGEIVKIIGFYLGASS